MKPAWAENLDWDHIREILGDRAEHLFRQLQWYAEHPFTRFDVTFHKRGPDQILYSTNARRNPVNARGASNEESRGYDTARDTVRGDHHLLR